MRTLKPKHFHILFISAFLMVSLMPYSLRAQPPLKDLRVIGSSVNFIFSTLDQYNTGITLTGWTSIRIKYQYTTKNAWQLKLNALDSFLRYEGDASNDIPISQLELVTTITSNDDPTTLVISPFVLSEISSTLVKGDGLASGVNIDISITYKIGLPPNIMMNKPEGTYFVDLRFLLVEQ